MSMPLQQQIDYIFLIINRINDGLILYHHSVEILHHNTLFVKLKCGVKQYCSYTTYTTYTYLTPATDPLQVFMKVYAVLYKAMFRCLQYSPHPFVKFTDINYS